MKTWREEIDPWKTLALAWLQTFLRLGQMVTEWSGPRNVNGYVQCYTITIGITTSASPLAVSHHQNTLHLGAAVRSKWARSKSYMMILIHTYTSFPWCFHPEWRSLPPLLSPRKDAGLQRKHSRRLSPVQICLLTSPARTLHIINYSGTHGHWWRMTLLHRFIAATLYRCAGPRVKRLANTPTPLC